MRTDTMDRYMHLIDNARKAYDSSETEWAKNFWLGVMKTLIRRTGGIH
jgi:hypothetical protein